MFPGSISTNYVLAGVPRTKVVLQFGSFSLKKQNNNANSARCRGLKDELKIATTRLFFQVVSTPFCCHAFHAQGLAVGLEWSLCVALGGVKSPKPECGFGHDLDLPPQQEH